MKKIMCILLFSVVILLAGCSNAANTHSDKVYNFYYCASPLSFGREESVVVAEKRTLEGQIISPEYIINDYLKGPVSIDLASPFPEGLYAESVSLADNRIQISMSNIYSELNGMDLTLANICLSKTMQELANVDYVYISYLNNATGKRSTITIGPDSYLLFDESSETTEQEE